MRLVKVKAPEGRGVDVAQVAFRVGISQVGVHQHDIHKQDGKVERKDVIDIETATPTAKTFIDALMAESFFNPKQFSIAVRQPRSIISRERPEKITWPLVEPAIDIFEELWQFSHITVGFIVRMLIAGMLLAYGMIEQKLLIMIAGLLFMPILPLKLAISFGALTKEWRLAVQGLLAFTVATLLLIAGGAAVAFMTGPPLRYNEHTSLLTSFLISLAIGIAAGFANVDDVGRRELIGLAATAQVAIIPVWFGITAVLGLSPIESASAKQRAITFFVNVSTIIVAAFITYLILGIRGEPVRHFSRSASNND